MMRNVSPNFHWQKSSSTIIRNLTHEFIDVAIANFFCKTRMPSCAIDSWQRLFRCSHREKNLSVKLAKKFKNLSVKLAKNGRKNILSVKVGVHHEKAVFIVGGLIWSGCTNQAESLEEREPPGTWPIHILYHKFYTTLFIQGFWLPY